MGKAKTLGELRASGYEVLPVKAEVRRNLIARLRRGEALFPGIGGYDETVIPQIVNAILGGQDVMPLGERGQAKSCLVRGLMALLDEETPAVKGGDRREPVPPDHGQATRHRRGGGRRDAHCVAAQSGTLRRKADDSATPCVVRAGLGHNVPATRPPHGRRPELGAHGRS